MHTETSPVLHFNMLYCALVHLLCITSTLHSMYTYAQLTCACSHANRVSGVDSTSLCEAHPGVLSDSLTEYVTQNANCAYLCSHVVQNTTCTTPSELHFSSTNIPATTPATSFTPHHSCELLPLPALATHPPHLPPLLQLSALSSCAIIC